MKNKKVKIITASIIIVAMVASIVLWYIYIKKPHDFALREYKAVIETIEQKNTELDKNIQALQSVVDTGEKPFDENILTTVHSLLAEAHDIKVIIGETPKKTADIISETEKFSVPVDYSDINSRLQENCALLEKSIKQLKQVTCPTEEFVIQRLETVEDITGIQAVTEDNDPNGNLNKAGGYTATVYFASIKIDQGSVSGIDIVDKGTQCGGAVEVYANVEDAEKRNTYLASFDGTGFFKPGSHKVVGTTVVRTSDELTATQQKELENAVINALTEIK